MPSDVRPNLIISDDELHIELMRMTDMHTDAIFGAAVRSGDAVVKFPVSRVVLDPERFIDDATEPMAARGMGVVYTKRHDGSALRENLDDKDRLIRKYYEPHHAMLSRVVDEHLAMYGEALIVDCHSFPSRPLPYEVDQNPGRPEICIGTDTFHTPDWLSDALVDAFTTLGYTVNTNTPFAGTIVPERHFRDNKAVSSVMIELRRDVYMDETSGTLLPKAVRLKSDVATAIYAVRAMFAEKQLQKSA